LKRVLLSERRSAVKRGRNSESKDDVVDRHPMPQPLSLADWARRESIPFDPASSDSFSAAVDQMMAAMDCGVALLGIGEPMHGAPEFQVFRNRLFERLVQAHGFSAIAIESSFPRGRIVNDYIAGATAADSPSSYDDLQGAGFSHGFGQLATTRELVEWMRAYNADSAHSLKLNFYGFDSPTEMMWTDSPRRVIELVLNYLARHEQGHRDERRARIVELIGEDAAWETQEAAFDPAKSIGLTPAAGALRLEIEELAMELGVRRPELVVASGEDQYLEAVHYAALAQQLLTYHACVARPSRTRVSDLLSIRDAIMADNLMYIVNRERERSRVLAFAHNGHLQYGKMAWQWGPDLIEWWPAGAHLGTLLGPRYAVIGTGVGTSETQGISQPESGSLEAMLTGAAGPARFIPTHRGRLFDAAAVAAIPTRSSGSKNPGYFPFNAQSLSNFDWLVVLDSIT
jgi:erythromycin esterase-like protein